MESATPSPAGDLDTELQNLIDWSDEADAARNSAACTSFLTGCQLW